MEELYNKTGILHFALCSVLIVATLLFPIECDSCPSDEFQCNFTKKCIPQSYKCDGDHWDCGPNDTSDENGCGNCTHGQYRCKKSKKCIDITYVCDEDKDCGDGDTHDEFNCLSCSRGKFHCPKSKKCISHDFRCNGIYGCDDKSDEDNCETCSPNVFHCNTSKRCLNSTKRCNGKNDCGSGDISDDLNCVNGCTGGFWCSVSLECVPSNKTCDLRADCMDASDENDCPPDFEISAYANPINSISSRVAKLSANVTSNRSNFSVTWKNSRGIKIGMRTGKYKTTIIYTPPLNYQVVLQINEVSSDDSGYYFVEVALNEEDAPKPKNLYLPIQVVTAPTFSYTNLRNSSFTVTIGKPLELICVIANASGLSRARLTWTWQENDTVIDWPVTLEYSFEQNYQILRVQNLTFETQGRITCTAENEYGHVSAYTDIIVPLIKNTASKITESSEGFLGHLFIIMSSVGGFLGFLVLFCGALVLKYKWKQRRLQRFLNGISQRDFYEGAMENMDPDLSVSDQAHLLPFQQPKWEILREKLQLGKTLGSGAFGLVLKAQAIGIVQDEDSTTVAIKTVKESADESHFKALITELKIMAHLGKHPNIVSLIGACTKNLIKRRELLVVMEFCKCGSLLNYMLLNRNTFINQLDPVTDKIKLSLCVQNFNKFSPERQTESTEQQLENPNDSLNYQGDYLITDAIKITSTDLLIWAFQAAKGMEYLTERKVLHGDLAARNVLLAENNVVKICDFGYARETFKNYDYKKNTKGVLLPIKWMAIESVYCGLFSAKSDCWSYGILLWEIFTLGNKPYPGMDVNEEFCQRINDGYRMEKPEYAPGVLYNIMKDCWAHEQASRPSFLQLSERIGQMILNVDQCTYLQVCEIYKDVSEDIKFSDGHNGNSGLSASLEITARYYELPTSSTANAEPSCSISLSNKSQIC